jgi:hypothetical protein
MISKSDAILMYQGANLIGKSVNIAFTHRDTEYCTQIVSRRVTIPRESLHA